MHLNWLNAIRNGPTIAEIGTKPHYFYKDSIYELEKSKYKKSQNPFNEAVYHRFIGNFNQDVGTPRSNSPVEISDKFRARAIKHFQSGINAIVDSIGYSNVQAIWLKMLIALQYTKEKNFHKSDSIYRKCIEEIRTQANGKTYYRQLNLPLFLMKWNFFNKSQLDNPNIEELEALIKSTLPVRRLYVSQYLKLSNNVLRESYDISPNPDLLRIELLKEDNKNFNNIWDFMSVQREFESYYESIQRFVGEEYFKKYNKALDSIQYEQMKKLDELFLNRNNPGLFPLKDTILVKHKINALDVEFDRIFTSLPQPMQRFFQSKSAVSLSEYQNSLEIDQATLFYSNSGYLDNQLYGICITIDTCYSFDYQYYKLLEPTFDSTVVNNYNTLLFNKLDENKVFVDGFTYFFEHISEKIKTKKRIKVFGIRGSSLPFELLSQKSENSIFKHENRLINKHIFSYSQNLSTDYLNKLIINTSIKNEIIFSNCGNQEKSQETPFMEKLAYHLSQNWNALVNININLDENQYNHLIFIGHGSQDETRILNTNHHDIDKSFNNNLLHLCNQHLSPLMIDSLNIQASFLALISCKAGDGLNTRLTGKYDFTWAFFKNGTKTILASPYELDDKTTAYILERFYNYLENGFWASEALQKAKLDFLALDKDPELNHPKYWAVLMLYGNDYKLENEKPFSKKIIGLLGIILIVGIGLFIRKRRLNSAA